MKNIFRISGIIFLSFLFYSCEEKPIPPSVTTSPITDISYTSATVGGEVIADGGADIISKGICWNTLVDPTVSNNKTIEGSGVGSFVSNVTQLNPNTMYFVRAYATNTAGTSYGNHIIFTTLKVTTAVLTTKDVESITQTSALSGGNISNENGGTITARGVCWGNEPNPTVSNSKTSDGTGIGNYTSTISGLTGNSVYFLRAYATNSAGTEYGNQVTFKTSPVIPALTTKPISSITATSCIGGGIISSDGGAPITDRGVCWSKTQNPSVSDTKVSSGIGNAAFEAVIIGLSLSTKYYIRAYATNSAGTGYGNELSFNTTDGTIVLTTVSGVAISTTSVVAGGNISSDGGYSVIERGTCLSTSHTPTINDLKTSDGSGAGIYKSSFTGLITGTLYYIRAFATNSQGTFYGDEKSFTIYSNTPGSPASDIDGNIYTTVKLGTQEWMVQDLKVTKYQNGDQIPEVTIKSEWIALTSGAYSNYNNDASLASTYGRLYNFYAVENSRKLCPSGWHVPSYDEWKILETFFGGQAFASTRLQSGTDGFKALMGGCRSGDVFNDFGTLGVYGHWWLSSQMIRRLQQGWADVQGGEYTTIKTFGASVRCIRD